MLKLIFLSTLFFISFNSIFSQTDKEIEKSLKIYKKNSSKGKSKLKKYINKAPNFGNNRGWEMLLKMEYQQYSQLKEMFSEMTIEVENEEAEDSLNLSTASDMKSTFLRNNETRFINSCREAAIFSTSSLADFYLRKFLIDFDPDTLVNKKALAYFNEGETFFDKEDFELAKMNYHKAISTDDTFYKAVLYLGDAFYQEHNYDSAIYYFSIAKSLQPQLLEPRKYLIDAFMNKELHVRAKKECLDAFCIYPSNGIKYRYSNILKLENKWLYTHHIKRDFYPNNISDSSQENLLPPYNTYRTSKTKAKRFTDKEGIITSSQIKDKYLEVFSWREFLNTHRDNLPKEFRFAQKMNQEGYLDCYIFFSLFHTDIYPQFNDFMESKSNREKMKYFITNFLIGAY